MNNKLFDISDHEVKANEEYGRIVYSALLNEFKLGNNHPFNRDSLRKLTRLSENQLSSGLLWAKEFADTNGLCIPDACSRNGFSYYLTDDPTMVIGSAWHATRKAIGATNGAQRQNGFISRNVEKMEGTDRKVSRAIIGLNAAQENIMMTMGELVSMGQDVYDEWSAGR